MSKYQDERKYPDKETILNLLKLGAFLTVAMLMPNAVKIFKGSFDFEPWEDFDHYFLRRNIKNLKRKGYVTYSEKDGKSVVKITDKGKTEILKFKIDELEIKRPRRWNGKWRIVLFDIPKRKKLAREILRNKLKELQFYPYQKSVFVFPFPCEKEIRFLREVLEVPDNVKMIVAREVENEEDLKKMFGLR